MQACKCPARGNFGGASVRGEGEQRYQKGTQGLTALSVGKVKAKTALFMSYSIEI